MTDDEKKKLDLPECFGDPNKYRHSCKCGAVIACVSVCIDRIKEKEKKDN